MSNPSGSSSDRGRSAGRILLDVILLAGIPTILIYAISKVWK